MRNQPKTILHKQIPATLGLLVFFFSIGTLLWLSANTVIFGTKAAAGSIPKNMQITNITNTGFTVTYTTDEAVIGSLAYGSDTTMGHIVFDDRDGKTGKPEPYTVHHITVSQLTPSTAYFFGIASGDTTVLNNNVPFTATTAATLTTQSQNEQTVSGKVVLDTGALPTEGIVYVATDDSQTLSTLLSPDGSYSLSLANLRSRDLTAFVNLTPQTVLHVTIVTSSLQSNATVLAGQSNSIPVITLGKNYDFTLSTTPLSASSASTSAQPGGFTIPVDTTHVTSPEILAPAPQQKLQDPQPMFKGKTLPNESVQITIQSQQEIQTTIQSDANGNWQFRPPVQLAPGQHTITIVSKDINGVLQTVSQNFTVYASGSQFTEPSISPSPTATPSATPFVVPTLVPTATPTIPATPSATPTSTIQPAISPTVVASITAIPTTEPTLPKTGSNALVLGIFGSLSAIGIGAALFFLTAL